MWSQVILVGSHMGCGPSQPVAEEYEAALDAFARGRVAVYSLDVTNADHHTLEARLQAMAADTGGFYARSHEFTAAATDRLKGALQGHYLLAFPRPDLKPGFHAVELRLARGGGAILDRGGYRD